MGDKPQQNEPLILVLPLPPLVVEEDNDDLQIDQLGGADELNLPDDNMEEQIIPIDQHDMGNANQHLNVGLTLLPNLVQTCFC